MSALAESGIEVVRVSSVIETEALLLPGSPPSWDQAFLNLVLEGRTTLDPFALLDKTQNIERALGRDPLAPRWSPRAIDIDILLWDQRQVTDPRLRIPHPEMCERAFMLGPLSQLAPELVIPGQDQTVLDCWRRLPRQEPLWMGIVNLTPDSFSDGGRFNEPGALESHLVALEDAGSHYIDLGAESTRPNATPVDADTEWSRLAPALEILAQHRRTGPLAPKISIDTRHPRTAARALEWGVDMVNDVTGLTQAEMRCLARGSDTDWVAMHHTVIPVDPSNRISPDADPVAEVHDWFRCRQTDWAEAGLDLNRILIDPGIGFGKSAPQSWHLLRGVIRFHSLGHRVLIGHSRKSFMHIVTSGSAEARDPDTLGISLRLLDQGVSVLRVHDVSGHVRAYRTWRHMVPQTQ